jgi:hypothetical protein
MEARGPRPRPSEIDDPELDTRLARAGFGSLLRIENN